MTNVEGVFASANLMPGPYIVHIAPQHRDDKAVSEGEELAAFSDDAFKTIDQDFETSYWPGGLPTPDQVLPISVEGGGIANAGTITVRKIPYYRVRVTLNGECQPRERWTFRIRSTTESIYQAGPQHFASCKKDSILTTLSPGSYELALWSGRDFDRWALVTFTIKDENVTVSLTMNDASTITGRILAAPGADLKDIGMVNVFLRSSQGLPSNNYAEVKDGAFTFNKVPWKAQRVSTLLQSPSAYVKEIRYNSQTLRDPNFDASPGSMIDVLVDTGAASLQITFTGSDRPFVGRALLVSTAITEFTKDSDKFEPFIFVEASRTVSGPLMFKNIPPGDYRLIAMPNVLGAEVAGNAAFAARFQQAPKITLERGEQKSIELQLKP